MSTRALPHDPYITAVTDALTAADMPPAEHWTDDGETRGTYCYLGAVITLDPSGTYGLGEGDTPAGADWPHGLILIWEWHTGAEDDAPERGPVWLFAQLEADGSNEYPTSLPVAGYAGPAAIVEAARRVIVREIKPGHFHNLGQPGWDGGTIGDPWEHADELGAVCEAWGSTETATA